MTVILFFLFLFFTVLIAKEIFCLRLMTRGNQRRGLILPRFRILRAESNGVVSDLSRSWREYALRQLQ